MKKNAIFLFTSIMLVLSACNKDDDNRSNEANAAAFVNQSVNIAGEETTVRIVFLSPTTAAGTVTLSVAANNAVYGTDFTTSPEVSSNTLTVPFGANVSSAAFTFNRLIEPFGDENKNVVFTITAVSLAGITIPDATNLVQLNFNEVPVESNISVPTVGGANVPNQVYFDLSSAIETPVQRTKWDLGFSSGTDFRVAINGAIKMAVKQLSTADITQTVEIDTEVAVGEGGGTGVIGGNIAYVDGPDGNINTTAIAVSSNDADNKVYLVNLGYGLTNIAPNLGSVNAYGDARGWKKIRVLRSGNDFKLQYAALDAATFNEVIISKNDTYNFTFFSFDTNSIVTAEPQKAKWDLNFTPFTNHANFGTGLVSYSYQDFIVINSKGGTRAYQVLNSEGGLYADFTIANVVTDNFNAASAIDQRAIGSNWRNGGGPTTLPSPKDDRFYVVKNGSGKIYKIRFIAMTNDAGERGNPVFEYQLLN